MGQVLLGINTAWKKGYGKPPRWLELMKDNAKESLGGEIALYLSYHRCFKLVGIEVAKCHCLKIGRQQSMNHRFGRSLPQNSSFKLTLNHPNSHDAFLAAMGARVRYPPSPECYREGGRLMRADTRREADIQGGLRFNALRTDDGGVQSVR